MHPISLYAITVLVWGSTWLAITYQFEGAHIIASVAYRFLAAAVLLLAWCRWRGLSMPRGWKNHIWLALLGACYAVNYLLVYYVETFLPSGLVAVALSITLVFNLVLARFFFSIPLSRELLSGLSLGLIGIFCLFWPELSKQWQSGMDWSGLGFCALAALGAACANMIALRNQKHHIDVLPMNAWWMTYMAGIVFLVGWWSNISFSVQWSIGYAVSFSYLVLFGSIVAFAAYLSLLKNMGAERASYISVFTPLVALIFSTAFEAFEWQTISVMGAILTLTGNVLVIHTKRPVVTKTDLHKPAMLSKSSRSQSAAV